MPVDPRRIGRIQKALLKKDILHAQANTKSHAEAARFLDVHIKTYRQYAEGYDLYNNAHKNSAGRGIPKKKKRGLYGLDEILAGKHPNYDRRKLKERLINAGYLAAECSLCGHNKTRPNGHAPLLICYKDGNVQNLERDNLYLLCYNCTYLTTGRIGVTIDDVTNVLNDGKDYTIDTQHISQEDIEKMQSELMKESNNE